jgi:hypothetical protein
MAQETGLVALAGDKQLLVEQLYATYQRAQAHLTTIVALREEAMAAQEAVREVRKALHSADALAMANGLVATADRYREAIDERYWRAQEARHDAARAVVLAAGRDRGITVCMSPLTKVVISQTRYAYLSVME